MSRELSGNILHAFYFWQDGFQRIYFDKPRFWLEAATRARASSAYLSRGQGQPRRSFLRHNADSTASSFLKENGEEEAA